MPEYNVANRQTCDVDIRAINSSGGYDPFIDFTTANTTTTGLSGETVYARAKGTNKIPFADPMTGTMTIEAQVYPYKLFSMYADGTISSGGIFAETETVTAAAAGSITLAGKYKDKIKTGSLIVYPEDDYGDSTKAITGTLTTGTFSATTASDISKDAKYKAAYLVDIGTSDAKFTARKISFKNSTQPGSYYITQKTVDKDEFGTLTPFVMVAYKATPQRNFELSFSSDGDPATVTMTFDLNEDKNGDILDFIEIKEKPAAQSGNT